MNYYQTLGVDKKASGDEIKKAFRALSMEKHPDKCNGSHQEFSKINEAYETLRDKEKRKIYDFNNMSTSISDYGDVGNVNMDLNDFFSEMLSCAIDKGVKKGKGKKINEFAAVFGMPGIDDDVQFDPSIFMNPMYNDTLHQKPVPEDIVIAQVLTYQESYNGCYIPIKIVREIKKGSMRKTETETIYINIDKGVDENEIITIREKGNIQDSVAGDIKVKIVLERHSEYTRRGIDLILHKTITFKESLCGFEFNIEHINGKSIKFTSSRGNVIQNGDEKTIKKLGFHRNDLIGNLILSFHVKQPETLREDQLKLIEDVF